MVLLPPRNWCVSWPASNNFWVVTWHTVLHPRPKSRRLVSFTCFESACSLVGILTWPYYHILSWSTLFRWFSAYPIALGKNPWNHPDFRRIPSLGHECTKGGKGRIVWQLLHVAPQFPGFYLSSVLEIAIGVDRPSSCYKGNPTILIIKSHHKTSSLKPTKTPSLNSVYKPLSDSLIIIKQPLSFITIQRLFNTHIMEYDSLMMNPIDYHFHGGIAQNGHHGFSDESHDNEQIINELSPLIIWIIDDYPFISSII